MLSASGAAPPAAATPPATSGAAPVSGSGESAAAPASAQEGVSAEGLRQYRLSLARAARCFKDYPPLARERGWEGSAEVTVTVGRLQPMPGVALTRSSGIALLDEQALAMIGRAAGLVALPQTLQGQEFRMPMTIRFSLGD